MHKFRPVSPFESMATGILFPRAVLRFIPSVNPAEYQVLGKTCPSMKLWRRVTFFFRCKMKSGCSLEKPLSGEEKKKKEKQRHFGTTQPEQQRKRNEMRDASYSFVGARSVKGPVSSSMSYSLESLSSSSMVECSGQQSESSDTIEPERLYTELMTSSKTWMAPLWASWSNEEMTRPLAVV